MKLNGAAVVIIKLIPSTKTFNRGRGEKERRKPFARSNGKSQLLFILISFTPAARERKNWTERKKSWNEAHGDAEL